VVRSPKRVVEEVVVVAELEAHYFQQLPLLRSDLLSVSPVSCQSKSGLNLTVRPTCTDLIDCKAFSSKDLTTELTAKNREKGFD
jgi:hypothetical protein